MMLATILVLAAAAAEPDFSWLAGCWEEQSGGGAWSEECWTAPRGGMLMGSGRGGKGDATTSYEFMRIARGDDGSWAFWGSPGGAAPVAFRLVEARAGTARFENPDHDYPQTITYRIEGDELVATISWVDGAKLQTWRYRRK